MNLTKKRLLFLLLLCGCIWGCTENKKAEQTEIKDPKKLLVSENGRYLITGDGKPFFWLGDTGWLMFGRLTREEAIVYLDDRKKKGFNVIQAMLLHDVPSRNVYKDSSVVRGDVAKPAVTAGSDYKNPVEYDYWDHIDYMVDEAAARGIYVAMVPVWGTVVKDKKVNKDQAEKYASFLANRYKDKWNIIWLNGGDIKGDVQQKVWEKIGETLRAKDPNHLITFHPRGRTSSTDWFHNAKWLDFNMFQSGHRTYKQDTSKNEKNHYGPDNYKYAKVDYQLKPVKPTIDGEPSYEDIPYGLHFKNEPRWQASDLRRYGYWSVFAGAFGYTYGHNSIMQMYKKTDPKPAYWPHDEWFKAIDAEGATQMIHLKNLMLSRSYLDRVPDQSLVLNSGEKYNYIAATRGENYAMFYTYTGGEIKVDMSKITWPSYKVTWFNPRDGKVTEATPTNEKASVAIFKPTGEVKNGNDWVLIIDKIEK